MKQLKLLTIAAVSALAALSLVSCRQDKSSEWLDRVPIFDVYGPDGTTNLDVSLTGRAQTVEFSVLASGAWTAEVQGDNTFSLSATNGGSGINTVTLSTQANESEAVRTAVLTFALGDKTHEFAITQAIQEPYLEASPSTVSILGYGGDFTVEIETNQEDWSYTFETATDWITETARTGNTISFTAAMNTTGVRRTASIMFTSPTNSQLYAFVDITQGVPAAVPTDLILDVVFNADGSAYDSSTMGMTVDYSRLNSDNGVKYIDRFGLYAATFNNTTVARSSLDAGYYRIPYTTDSDFANKIADGCTYELVFCTYYDPFSYTDGTKQVKTFCSTQAGGMGVCLQVNTAYIQFETHVGGSWQSPASSIVPVAYQYYHVIGVFDKENQAVSIYVDGELQASRNASGDFKFQTTNVDARWFGIGADPNANDQGEASLYGEIVVARLYDAPMTSDEVMSCYKQLMDN